MDDTPETNPPSGEPPLIADEISNQQIGARVPENVAQGVFTTGTIVTLGAHEFVLDFLLRMGRPHILAARVILPPGVAALAANLLQKGIASYEARFGKIGGNAAATQNPPAPATPASPAAPPAQPGQQTPRSAPPDAGSPVQAPPPDDAPPPMQQPIIAGPANVQPPPASPRVENRPGSLRDTYDDLKVTDQLVTGAYANSIMVSHNDAVFQLDFIANFPPYAMVVKRIFLPINQAPRLADAMKITLQRHQMNQQSRRKPPTPEANG